jgi:hypothetical protein
LTAEVLAGERVGELVHDGHAEQREPDHDERLERVERWHLGFDPRSRAEQDHESERDDSETGRNAPRGEEPAEPSGQSLEQAIRVEGPEAQVEEAALQAPRGGRRSLGSRPFQEPEPVEPIEEALEALGRERASEALFRTAADLFDGGGAVELASDEVLDFPEAEETPGFRLLGDVVDRTVGLAALECEIRAQLRERSARGGAGQELP